MNFNTIVLITILIASCGVKSPPKASGDTLPSIDSIYMDKAKKKVQEKKP